MLCERHTCISKRSIRTWAPGEDAAQAAITAARTACAGRILDTNTERPAMSSTSDPNVRPQQLADEAIALVRRWLAEAAEIPADASAARLAGVLKDPNGLDFTVGFVDGVVRPEDTAVAAQ